MQPVRQPVVAGMFYNLNPRSLEVQVDELFSGIKPRKTFSMAVSPHAGYAYSGRTAAYSIVSLQKKGTYIIIGPNHTGYGPEFSVMSSGSWMTPLGTCSIDQKIAARLKKSCDFLKEDTIAHSHEHSVEVQLPLLQHRFKDPSFVPVCIMNMGYSNDLLEKCVALGKEIATILKAGNTGVIASSDFSHYLPLKIAEKKDGAAMECIMSLDMQGFFQTLEEEDASICGFGPIAVAMAAAKELRLQPALINKSSSGDVTGDYSSVVTYYAIGFG